MGWLMVFSLATSISYAHAYGVEHSYIVVRGSNVFQTCPLGKVHKSGRAILCAYNSASLSNIV